MEKKKVNVEAVQPETGGWKRRLLAVFLDVCIFLLISFGGYVLWSAFCLLLFAPDGEPAATDAHPWMDWASEVGLLCAVLLSAWLVLHRRGMSLRCLGLSFRWRSALGGLCLAVAIYALGLALLCLGGMVRVEAVSGSAAFLGPMLGYFLLVSLAEELMMRGFLLGRMLDGGIHRYASLFLSSLFFSLLHLFNPDFSWLSFLNILLAGMLLGIPYVHTRSLSFSVSFHWFWNWLQGPVLGYHVSGNETSESLLSLSFSGPSLWSGGSFGFEGSLLCTMLLLLAIGGLLYRYGRRQKA